MGFIQSLISIIEKSGIYGIRKEEPKEMLPRTCFNCGKRLKENQSLYCSKRCMIAKRKEIKNQVFKKNGKRNRYV